LVAWRLAEKTWINKRTVKEKYVLDPSETLDHATYLKAYKGSRSNVDTPISNPSFATTELSDTEYGYIQNDDGSYISSYASATQSLKNGEVAHLFGFDLTKFVTLPNVLDKIEYGWDGYLSGGTGMLFRNTPVGWKTIATSLPTSDGSGIEFTETITNMVAVLINKWFWFGVYGACKYLIEPVSITLYTDYVYVTVTYHISDLMNAPIIKPRVVGVSGYER